MGRAGPPGDFIICSLHLISSLILLLLLLEALEPEGSSSGGSKSSLRPPPSPSPLLPAAPKMPEVVPWPRYDAQHHLGLGRQQRHRQRATMPTSLGVRGGRTAAAEDCSRLVATGSRRQEAEFVLVEASVRSGSGSGVELTPEVGDIRPQRLHQHHRDGNHLGDGLVLSAILISGISLKGNYLSLSSPP